jgi:hypothetical protein
VCPTRYQTWHFVNNSNTNEDIATKFEQEYVHISPRKSSIWALSKKLDINTLISGKIIKEMLCSVVSGTPYILENSTWSLFTKKKLKRIINTSQNWLETKFHDSMKTDKIWKKHYNF